MTDNKTMDQQQSLTIAMIGLPSAGKSTLINSLVGKHILRTGVCRTTKDVYSVGPVNVFNFPSERYVEEKPISDDGVEYSVIDLPGVCDGQNKGHEYDEKSSAWISNANVICWVSDIQSAFLTTHEKTEFDKYKTQIDNIMLQTGTLYQMCIILTKYDFNDSNSDDHSQQNIIESLDEIDDDEEETTVHDCYKRVVEIFKDYSDIKIIKFNAFGRIMHNDKVSSKLKKLVKKEQLNVNTTFNIKWMIDDYVRKEQQSKLKCVFDKMIKIYDTHAQTPTGYDKIICELLDGIVAAKKQLNSNGLTLIRQFLFDSGKRDQFYWEKSSGSFSNFLNKKTFDREPFIKMQNTVWVNAFSDTKYSDWMDSVDKTQGCARLYMANRNDSNLWKYYYMIDTCKFKLFLTEETGKTFSTPRKMGLHTLDIKHNTDWFTISSSVYNKNYLECVIVDNQHHEFKPEPCKKIDVECVTTNNVCKCGWLEEITSLRKKIWGYSHENADTAMLVMSLRQKTISGLFQQIK